MLTIKEALQLKPQFILGINYNDGSLGEMMGEPRDLDLYLADMTIQYSQDDHSTLSDNACLSFTIECLVKVNDDKVTIEEMDTSSDSQSVYSDNISDLLTMNGSSVDVWGHDTDSDLREVLKDLIEDQPIYDVPAHYTIESH